MTGLAGFFPFILSGAWITIQVAVCSLLFGLIIGLLGAGGEVSKIWWLRCLTISIISIIRGLPELLVIFFVYFGGTLLLTVVMGHYVNVSAFMSGVTALGLLFGAYASQVFRGAFMVIPKGQIESGRALGLSTWQIFQHIQLPQAWRYALPGLGNLWLILLKDTSLVSLIGLTELMNKSQIAASTTHQPFTFYLTAALLYLVMTSCSQIILKKLSVNASKHLKP